MLKKRVVTALLITPIPFTAIWFGEPWFTVLISVVAVLGAIEFYRLATASGASPLTFFGIGLVLCFVVIRNPDLVSLIEPNFNTRLVVPILLALAVVFPVLRLILRPGEGRTFINWLWTIGGILYVGWLLSHLVALRGVADGRNWLFLVILANAASDTFAFFIGRSFGRHHLAPLISPKKTWEGALAGVAGAMILSPLFTTPRLFSASNALYIEGLLLWQALVLGILISVFGQLGDLTESLLKRNAGVKDSGKLLPGHGGILDRLDSILFAGVVVYYYIVWVM